MSLCQNFFLCDPFVQRLTKKKLEEMDGKSFTVITFDKAHNLLKKIDQIEAEKVFVKGKKFCIKASEGTNVPFKNVKKQQKKGQNSLQPMS